MTGLIIDNFAGGGGASTGIEAALGRAVDIAINHDPEAVAMHAANHPATRHFCQSIMAVDPLEATGGRPVALAWFSPDCKHHSKAKGGKPREKNIRDLAWIVVHWAERLRKATPDSRGAPAIIMLENVEEFRQWGPLDAEGKPIPERRGEEFDLWLRGLKRQGYKVEFRELRACDYGAPTSRKRLFLIARRDGLPIVWPEPTHGKPGSPEVLSGARKPWRAAAECIDWEIPCPSIFDREKELVEATKRRIAVGVVRFVVEADHPYQVNNAAFCLDRQFGTSRGASVVTPIGSAMAGSAKTALVSAFLHKYRPHAPGVAMSDQFPVVTANSFIKRPGGAPPLSLVYAHMEQANTGVVGHPMSAPISTIVGKGCTQRLVETTMLPADALPPEVMAQAVRTAAFLVKYYGNETDGHGLDAPIGTVTTKDRFAVVTVTIDALTYVIVDIGMRMLTPRELARAQGFPDSYILDCIGPSGKPLTKTAQIRMIGNSVCPDMARALVEANLPGAQNERVAA